MAYRSKKKTTKSKDPNAVKPITGLTKTIPIKLSYTNGNITSNFSGTIYPNPLRIISIYFEDLKELEGSESHIKSDIKKLVTELKKLSKTIESLTEKQAALSNAKLAKHIVKIEIINDLIIENQQKLQGLNDELALIKSNIEVESDIIKQNILDDIDKGKEGTEKIKEILKIFGNRTQTVKRMINGVLTEKVEQCLGITEDVVLTNIMKHNYESLIYIKNDDFDDSATGAMQYYNWCAKNNDDSKQLWIHDICRVNNSKTKLKSPVSVLFDAIEQFSLNYNILSNYVIVEGEQPGTDTLISIYNNYGFIIDDSCTIETYKHTQNNGTVIETSAIAMKKSLIRRNALHNNQPMNAAAAHNNVAAHNNQPMNAASAHNNIQLMNNTSGGKKRKTRKNKNK